ncbi:MAG: hypothetical protein K2O04_04435 [Clostridiales bacterium]|nr:hypothetical protein [Clostridiales bacterium]
MVGTIAMAAAVVSVALSSAALPALAPITEEQPGIQSEVATTVGFVKKECSAETLRFVKNATNNIDALVTEYNSVISADMQKMNVEFVEYSKPVYIIEEEKYGVYLDFNDSNGYLVMTDDNVMYALNTTDDLKYLRDADELYFSVFDGFMYLDEDGYFSSYNKIEDNFSMICAMFGTNSSSSSSGDKSRIEPADFTTYMNENYPDYVLETKVDSLSSNFDYSRQMHTNYYVYNYIDSDGNYVTAPEGNCVLHASYMTLRNWCKQGFVNINGYADTVDIRSSIKSDPLYSLYGVGNKMDREIKKKTYEGTWQCNYSYYLSTMPKLYTEIRDYALDNGYTVVHYPRNEATNILEHVANNIYGNDIKTVFTSDYTPARINLVDRKASVISINESSSYGNHSAALIGVCEYVKKTDYGAIGMNHYLRIYVLADGYSTHLMYYDPNKDPKATLFFSYLKSADSATLPRC